MALTNLQKNQHLLWRAAFGPMAEMMEEMKTMNQKELWKLLKETANTKYEPINVVTPFKEADMMADGSMIVDRFKKRLEKSRDDLKKMNLLWLSKMVGGEGQLREKVAFFFHGHFATRSLRSEQQQHLINVIRKHALGNFKELLFEVSKSAAMLQFLNNQQNKKGHPNENFAREVMELFTLGRGNYTENDIKEAARAFTGWSYNDDNTFFFRKNQHDDGVKTFLGETGNFTGDDILNILLAEKQTALYIVQKMFAFFVNEKLDKGIVQELANAFYNANYDIMALLEAIFTSKWFYDEKNVGVKIKSPVELLAGIRRLLPMTLVNENTQLLFQRSLGQVLFYPPNVAGWPGGKNWIDSSTLMLRLRIPKVFAAQEVLAIKAKDDDDVQMGEMNIEKRTLKAAAGGAGKIDWTLIIDAYKNTTRENLYSAISNNILQTKQVPKQAVMDAYISKASRENFIKTTIISLMSTPEYQMC
jgi:uncharacterized protein (DUF1800 family)